MKCWIYEIAEKCPGDCDLCFLIEQIEKGLIDKAEKGPVKIYKAGNIIRIDIKMEVSRHENEAAERN